MHERVFAEIAVHYSRKIAKRDEERNMKVRSTRRDLPPNFLSFLSARIAPFCTRRKRSPISLDDSDERALYFAIFLFDTAAAFARVYAYASCHFR